ncbi:sulfotransferase family protein [Alicyclobacillus cycloheptanicus]|uniref:Sulfotransferase domain-containing protein n=1 Tax=Alicyclobacillus cycloheptanicus TaxID=1457 RepID=A0ABT9XM68_9BACL|nr:sulfotransferase [Alicyclobacillus cycloheptanicus]MDQ0191408.1 hypothetical protein [Alicyclobacillus cycloheptanicus]
MSNQPNLFIAGAAKSGTTSLYAYLQQHPDIYMSPIKEPHYLCSHHFPETFTGPGDEDLNVVRTEAAYRQLFDGAADYPVTAEASVYYLYFPDTAEKIQAWNPEAKVILLLRNPVDRAFSAYKHTIRDGRETLSFEQALEAEPKRRAAGYQPLWWYREIGLYYQQVKRYLDVLSPERVKIFLYDDLKDTAQVVKDSLEFLGLSTDVKIDVGIRHNVSGVPKSRAAYEFFAKPNVVKEIIKPFLPKKVSRALGERAKLMTMRQDETMKPETAQALKAYYREDILHLQELIGRDLSHWLR